MKFLVGFIVFSDVHLVKLMEDAKVSILNPEGLRRIIATINIATLATYKIRQSRYKTLTKYKRRFLDATEVLKHIDIALVRTLNGLENKRLRDKNSVKRAKATDN